MDLQDYIELHSSKEPEVLAAINRETNLEVLNAHMLSGHVQGRFLSMLSRMIRPRRILELGTYTGYSAICLAEGLAEGGELVTVEHNDELEERIRSNIARSGYSDRIRLVIADACAYMSGLRDSSSELFDLVFIDADKRCYTAYLDAVLPLLSPMGWVLADNTMWDGHVVDEAYDRDEQTMGLKAFNDRVAMDKTLDKVIVPIRDGLTIIRRC